MVWCSRQDRMGDLSGLRSILRSEGLGQNPQKRIPLPVDSASSRSGNDPLGMDQLSFPA
jgi:hypothetical protein